MTVTGDHISIPKSLFWGAVTLILALVGSGGFFMGGLSTRVTTVESSLLAFANSTRTSDGAMSIVSGHLERIQAQIDFLIARDQPRDQSRGDKR